MSSTCSASGPRPRPNIMALCSQPLAGMTSPASIPPDCAFLRPPLYLARCRPPLILNQLSTLTTHHAAATSNPWVIRLSVVLNHLQSHCKALECFQMINSFCFVFKERSVLFAVPACFLLKSQHLKLCIYIFSINNANFCQLKTPFLQLKS